MTDDPPRCERCNGVLETRPPLYIGNVCDECIDHLQREIESAERDSRIKRARIIIALAIVGMLFLTPVCLLLSYCDWSDLFKFGWHWDRLRVFNRWPWIRVSILLTLLSTLVAIAGAAVDAALPTKRQARSGFGVVEARSGFGVVVIYLVLGMPLIVFFLLHPGLEALGLHSDRNVGRAWFSLTVLHAAGVCLIYSHTWECLYEMQQKAKEGED